jgi:transcriptional regulator GlxA family with amidase domain
LLGIAGEALPAMKMGTITCGAKPLSVGILGFDGLNALDLTGPLETLATARTDETEKDASFCYDVRVIGVTGKSFVSESGIGFKSEDTLSRTPTLDTIIVPGGAGIRTGETNRKVADWLRVHASDIRRTVSVCTGIYPVAKSGLLDGRKVTTHWRFAQDVRKRFPKLRLDHTSSFIKDGQFYTCGGGTAAIEMTLALLEEDYGSRLAISIARELVMRLRPPGDNESPFDPYEFDCGPTDRLADLPAWIGTHLNEDLSVEVLAERTCLCPRHFSRLFKNSFNATPAAFVEQLRLDEARRRLLIPRNRVENVARAVGFKNADSFRRAFRRRHGINPVGYQRSSRRRIPNASFGRDAARFSPVSFEVNGREPTRLDRKPKTAENSLRLAGAIGGS